MRASQIVVVGLLVAMGAAAVSADMITPSHSCSKPIKPSQFASEGERRNYNRQVGSYKQCFTDFINEQNRAARLHTEAARDSLNERKSIVNQLL